MMHAYLYTEREINITSAAFVRRASQSSRGRMLLIKDGFRSTSACCSSASLKWRGNEAAVLLHALTAQVKKFTVSNFISARQSKYNCERTLRPSQRWKARVCIFQKLGVVFLLSECKGLAITVESHHLRTLCPSTLSHFGWGWDVPLMARAQRSKEVHADQMTTRPSTPLAIFLLEDAQIQTWRLPTAESLDYSSRFIVCSYSGDGILMNRLELRIIL